MAGPPSTSRHILTYIDARFPVRCHEHIAVLRRGGDSGAGEAEFISEGLLLRQRCCYLSSAALHPGMRARLVELGVDVERHLNDQTLQFPQQSPGTDHWLNWGEKFFADAESAHAPAVRWLEEGGTSSRTAISVPSFFELHSRLNYLVKQYPSVALCRYNLDQLEIPHLFSIITVHRHLLLDGTLVRDNPFYIPAEKFIAMNPEDREHDLRNVFRAVGFDLERLFSTLTGYGRLQPPALGS